MLVYWWRFTVTLEKMFGSVFSTGFWQVTERAAKFPWEADCHWWRHPRARDGDRPIRRRTVEGGSWHSIPQCSNCQIRRALEVNDPFVLHALKQGSKFVPNVDHSLDLTYISCPTYSLKHLCPGTGPPVSNAELWICVLVSAVLTT